MSYAQGQNISAADFTAMTGTTPISVAYASSAAATSKVAALLGVGYGDRGYGQTSEALPTSIVPGTPISGTYSSHLRNALFKMASHQGTSLALLPPLSNFDTGNIINAEAPPTSAYDFATMIANVDANRFNTNSGASMSLTANALTITRASNWGGSVSGITAVATVSFESENAARYFFNSGGEIRLAVSHPTGSTQDNNWNTALSSVGTISFGAHGTTRTGSSGSPANIGYYELTTTDQAILSGAIGSGAYSTNSIAVSAKASSIAGSNGAKGSSIVFTITLTDSHTNTFSDICASGTKVVFSHLKATMNFAGIANPTYVTNTTW